MTNCGSSILTDPPAGGHLVYPYTDEAHVVQAVSLYAASGLEAGDAVVLVMTYPHCQKLEERLTELGFDLPKLKSQDRLICADAARTMSTFMIGDEPDGERFRAAIRPLLERAKATIRATGRVRAFGEMVSLLYLTNPKGALRLEELWNDVVRGERICLFCTYHLAGPSATLADDLCAAHSHYIVAV